MSEEKSKKIINLELELIVEEESSMIGGEDLMILGKLTIRKYNSRRGDLEIHELSNNERKKEEYIFTKNMDFKKIGELHERFYGFKTMAITLISKDAEKLIMENQRKYI